MKSAFITGAATGMGKAYVDVLLENGWRVFAGFIPVNQEIPEWKNNERVSIVCCDVTDPDDIKKAKEFVASHTGGALDLLINNAGAGLASGPVESAYMENVRTMMEVNLWGIVNVAHEFVPLVKAAKGRIINVSSPAVYLTMPLGFGYPVSKAAAKSLSMHMRMELEPFGVQVTNLEPGGVETEMIRVGRDASTTWDPMPDELRDVYENTFYAGMEAMESAVKFIPPEEFARQVYKKVICKKKLKPSYQVGPGSRTIALLNKFLSEERNQGIWRKIFTK